MLVALFLLAACSGNEDEVGKIVIKGGGNGGSADVATGDPHDGTGAATDSSVADVAADQPDVAGPDAGADDAAPDTPVPDAGAIDSAQMDAGPTDAAVGDAGPVGDSATAADAPQGDGGPVGNPPDSCQADKDCNPWGLVCDTEQGSCVACVYGSDCMGLFPICVDNKCDNQMPCKDDAPCAANGMVCDAFVGHCVDCVKAENCKPGWLCKAAVCIPPPTVCQSSKSCASVGQVCDKALGACVDCLDDADCAPPEFCLEGLCLPDICKPGLQQCANISTVQSCVDSGAGWSALPCEPGFVCAKAACAKVICTGGATECVDGGMKTCDVTGSAWSAPEPCAGGSICLDGACKAAICKPGASQCGVGGVQTCSADGTAWQTVACPTGQSCSVAEGVALCFDHKCAPSKAFCDGAVATQCTGDGLGTTVVADCAAKGQDCVDGACKADKCTPAELSCKGDQLAVCDGSGTAWILQPCPNDTVCKANQCVAAAPCETTLTAKAAPAKADIIVVIDTTSSMKSEFGHTNAAIGALGKGLVAAGVDHRVVVIGQNKDCCKICIPAPLGNGNCGPGPNLKRVNAYAEGGTQLSVIVSKWNDYKGFLRADATRHIIVISDDDSDKDAKWFKDAIANLSAPGFAKGFVMHGVVATKAGGCGDNEAKAVPQLANETGGKLFPVCEKSDSAWQGWFSQLAKIIGKGGEACVYPLTAPLQGLKELAKSITVHAQVGGSMVALSALGPDKACGNALEYSVEGTPPQSLQLCPASCKLVVGAPLKVTFPCP